MIIRFSLCVIIQKPRKEKMKRSSWSAKVLSTLERIFEISTLCGISFQRTWESSKNSDVKNMSIFFFFYNTALAWLKCCAIPNETFFWCLCILCVVWQQHCKNDNYKNVKKEISRLNSDIKNKFPLRCKSFGNLLWLLEDRTILMFPCCKSHLHIKAKNIYKMGTCVMSFVACISLGSEHLNESLPRRVYLQFESSLHGQRT